MTKISRATLLAGVALALGDPGPQDVAQANDRNRSIRADLRGIEEPPSISSTGSGEFRAKISRDETSFEYELTFEDLEGDVTQSHIHIAQKGVNGGISIWLCGTGAPEPRRARRYAELRRTPCGHGEPDGDRGGRDRSHRTGHRRRRVRGGAQGDPAGRRVRERPFDAEPRRRDPRADPGSQTETTTITTTDVR